MTDKDKSVPYIPASLVLANSVSLTTPDGNSHTITDSHLNYEAIREALRTKDYEKIPALIDISQTITNYGAGEITVKDGVVFHGTQVLHNVVTKAILRMLKEGFDIAPMVAFLRKLMENPSGRAANELYPFLEKGHFTITSDGDFLAYKRVDKDFLDKRTHKFDNSVGKVVEEARELVVEDRHQVCARGLHFCSISYLPHYGSADYGDHTVIVKINPRDVVSIPSDFDDAKGRACRYEVVGEHVGADTDDMLGRHVVLDFNPDADDENFDPDAEFEASTENFEKIDTSRSDGEKDGAVYGQRDAENGADQEASSAFASIELGSVSDTYRQGYRKAFLAAYNDTYEEVMADRPAEEPVFDLDRALTDIASGRALSNVAPLVQPDVQPKRRLFTRPDSRYVRLVGFAPKGVMLYVYNKGTTKPGVFEKLGPATGDEFGEDE